MQLFVSTTFYQQTATNVTEVLRKLKGLDIDHVVVFIDIGDVDDEANYYYECENQNNVCMYSWAKQYNIN